MSVHTSRRHDSALKHVTGQALYIDDLPEPAGTLHAALILSNVAAGRLRKLDLAAASSAPGVVLVLGPNDIPGKNDVAPVGQNEPLFAFDQIDYAGQPLAMVVAETLDAARHAAERAVIDIEAGQHDLAIETAPARTAHVAGPWTRLRAEPRRGRKTPRRNIQRRRT